MVSKQLLIVACFGVKLSGDDLVFEGKSSSSE